MKFLLDTNVVSEFHKGRNADDGVLRWSAENDQSEFAISAMTLKELEYGVLHLARREPSRSLALRAWLDRFFLPNMGDRIIAVDSAVAVQAAELDVPQRRPIADGLIAATALVHNLTVITRKTKGFAPMGVRMFNPFST